MKIRTIILAATALTSLGVHAALAEETAFDGPYAGVQLGYGTTLYDGSNRSSNAGDTYVQDFGSHNEPRIGVFAGYSKSFGKFVLSPELKAVYDHAEMEVWPSADSKFSLDKEYHFGAGLRAGYLIDPDTLVYLRGDAVRAKFAMSYTGDGSRQSQFVNGFDAGFGAEVGIGNGLFLRGEYLWTDYGDFDGANQSYQPFESMANIALVYRLNDTSPKSEGKVADFGGAYIGGQIGYGDANTKELQSDQSTNDSFYYGRPAHGMNGGIYGGYGVMLSRFYVGGELEASLANYEMEEKVADGTSAGWKMKNTYGAAARFGYRIADRAMIYTKVGVVRSGVEYHATGVSDSDDTLTGVRGGMGLEFAATDNLMVRGEYTHTSYGSMHYSDADGEPDVIKPRENLFRVGVAYKF